MHRFLMMVAVLVVLAPETARADISGKARVIDGDTIEIAGQRIRLHGIDAPEINQTCWDDRGEFPCGRRARHMLWLNVQGQDAKCDKRDDDRFGRIVAVCYAGAIDLGRDMVRLGWAMAYRKYSLDYVADEEQARRLRSGLWVSKFTLPWKWRAMMKNPLADPDSLKE